MFVFINLLIRFSRVFYSVFHFNNVYPVGTAYVDVV